MKKKRKPCICFKGFDYLKICESINHFCICKTGIKNTMFCKADKHPCLCLEDEYNK